MKKGLLFVVCYFVLTLSHAQQWFTDMYDPTVNFFTVQQEFNDWWNINKEEILNHTDEPNAELEGKWVIYKRWEHQLLPYMTATGGVRNGVFDSTEYNFNKYRNAVHAQRSNNPAWSYIGPPEPFNPGGVIGCKGRLNCVRFDPVDANTIYVGAPSGGIWKSTDAGNSWALLNTDTLAQIGVTDIAINPNNHQNIFIATGDFASQDSRSIGVLQSTNGGVTWSPTGLNWTISQGMEISRLLINPNNPAILIAATNNGIYRTTNSGNTWTHVNGYTNVSSMEFRPGNPNVVYACNTRFYRSTNGGATWSLVSTGLPVANTLNALAIGVTPADTNYVYLLASLTAASSTPNYNQVGGLYRSVNGGSSFALQSVPSQILTQGVYDLAVGVSPVNSSVLVVAAVTPAYSFDGGLSFSYPTTDAHVDHHDIRFLPNSPNKVYSADDGGLFVSEDYGNTWTGKNNGLEIGQIYVVAPSGRTAGLNLTGRQDDGTLMQQDSVATSLAPGDGTNCLIDPTTDSILYGSIQQGLFARSLDGGQSYALIVPNWGTGVNGSGEWVTPFTMNPQNHFSIYVGKDSVYQSYNEGETWHTLNTPALPSGNYWHYIRVAPSDTTYIYASSKSRIVRSANAGLTFTDISITGNNSNVWSFAVSPTNPHKIWATTGNGVYLSSDTGHSWSNISAGLPPVASYYPYTVTCLKNAPDAVYLGLHNGGGVYYTDSTLTGWVPFGTGLPNTSVENLEVSYAAGKLRAATYGRDLWETELYNNWYNPTVAGFKTGVQTCAGYTVQFNDVSSFNPTAWQWTFTGGNPSSSGIQNPIISFPGPGAYMVTLTTTNAYGSNSTTKQVFVNGCTGVENTLPDKLISIFPNPATNTITISVDESIIGSTAIITDITGRKIATVPLSSINFLVPTDNFANGVYLVSITGTGRNSAAKKLVISK